MRIGILTLPLHTNYGGILQAYALQTVLERFGHDVIIFDKQSGYKQKWFRLPFVLSFRFIKRIIGLYNGPIWVEKVKWQKAIYARSNTQKFIDQYLHIAYFDKIENIKPDDVDCIVVGSDQIWRARYFRNISSNPADMFLAFTEKWKVKRLAYAASFGTDQWELNTKDTQKCSYFAQLFDAISVREDSGVRLCSEKLHVPAEHVLDPTMLLSKIEYDKLIKADNTHRHCLVSYVLDRDSCKAKIVEGLSSQFGTEYSLNLAESPVPPVEFWLEGLICAEKMVTDSFHGTAFSINFNIPFVVLSNENRGQSRLESILKMFHLESRMVSSLSQALKIMNEPIDWDSVNSILETQRDLSIKFLSKLLYV